MFLKVYIFMCVIGRKHHHVEACKTRFSPLPYTTPNLRDISAFWGQQIPPTTRETHPLFRYLPVLGLNISVTLMLFFKLFF